MRSHASVYLSPASPPRHFAPRAALFACGLILSGCSFMKTQMALTALDTCLDKQCQGEPGAAREACSRSCRSQYGP
jgi:hypothetical protein